MDCWLILRLSARLCGEDRSIKRSTNAMGHTQVNYAIEFVVRVLVKLNRRVSAPDYIGVLEKKNSKLTKMKV